METERTTTRVVSCEQTPETGPQESALHCMRLHSWSLDDFLSRSAFLFSFFLELTAHPLTIHDTHAPP